MSWRIITVSNPGKLSVENKQLLYKPVEGEGIKVPIEDISVVLIETRQVILTGALLSEFAEHGIVLFTCSENHIPSGSFFPFHKHTRYSEIAFMQKEWAEPFKKRIWQEIIKTKILNQAYVLKTTNNKNWQTLENLILRVQSGDTGNSESFAAHIYWESLFENFTREKDDWRNSCLNYGYAIMRGVIARSIVGFGFLPCFGVNHASGLNAFNLADDLLEPFRPFVDLKVYKMFQTLELKDKISLSVKTKQTLLQILTDDCLFDAQKTTTINACDGVASSLSSATREKDYKNLKLPNFLSNNA